MSPAAGLAPGDWVAADDGLTGRLVLDLDAGQALAGWSLGDWRQLGTGVLVETVQAGPVHYPDRAVLRPAGPEGIAELMALRFGSGGGIEAAGLDRAGAEAIRRLLDRRACRRFRDEAVPEGLLRLVLGTGLAAPSKSDLQQADIVWVRDPAIRADVTRGCGDWLEAAPATVEILVICGDGRRLAALHAGEAEPWANDHFDALFNATGDAAILLCQLLTAAAMAGLGACPVSVMRNRAEAISDALGLPDRVFPFAGLALGWPAEPRAPISPRLGPSGALHVDRFDTEGQAAAIAAYDARRGPVAQSPAWSEAKRRQYATAQRTGWGEFLRGKGFRMD
ncbi:hypothetical protein LNKW23_17670 [Paralimibaculum aggregatum]|uniref:Nitroreductase domain-containing protein n=1 Tax=Paralimibaculum aggregatum TaxID=3036245 RepID=A0ABQ6LK44_9RHOB|nr:nitroreductase family protein [Limibaculum sp. NKW23]GMG82554.1 hypothetical protein LNKW23_17670 [Limibaculum sp. NKW23]